MKLTVRLFGLEFLHIEASTEDQADTDPGDCTTSPVGFVARLEKPDDVELPAWR